MAQPQTARDLETERVRASFPVRKMTELLYGGPERVALKVRGPNADAEAAVHAAHASSAVYVAWACQERMAKMAATDPKLDTTPMWFMGHSERYEYALGQTSYLQSLRHRLKLSIPEMEALISSLPDYYYPSVCRLGTADTPRPWLADRPVLDGQCGYATAGPARTSRCSWRRCRRRRPRSSWTSGCRGSSTAASAAATPKPSWLTYAIGSSRARPETLCAHRVVRPRAVLGNLGRRSGEQCASAAHDGHLRARDGRV